MRRHGLFALALPALAALLLAGQIAQAAEQQASMAVVQGLADGDMLNLRVTASPVGKIETRLPNGTTLKKFGCSAFNGYDWCEVQDIGNPRMRGWVPARYLLDTGLADDAAAGVSADLATGTTGSPQSSPAGNADAGVPTNFAARFGDGDPQQASSAAEEKSAAVRKAIQDAYSHAADDADATPDTAGIADTGADADAAAVPVPTPRPDRAGSGDAGTDAATEVARAEPPATPAQAAASATGEIPCARYVGQPMTRCAVSVVRNGADAADVTVTWPDGGTRIINFRDGKPEGSNARGEFRFTREGTLNMIRIGQSERFEITDALSFGD